MWPIMLTVLNLPRHVRNTFSNFALAGIIPSNGTGEPKHIAPFLDVVVNELLLLSSSMYDAYHDAPFSLTAQVLNYVLDYPGLAKVFSMTDSGSYLVFITRYTYMSTFFYVLSRVKILARICKTNAFFCEDHDLCANSLGCAYFTPPILAHVMRVTCVYKQL